MTLRERLDAELKDAMRARDQVRMDTVRAVRSAITYREVETKATLDEAGIVKVVAGLVKQRRDSVEAYKAGNRPDLVAKEEREAAILQGFLPAALGEDELRALVDAAVAETGAKGPRDMGAVMKALQTKVAGRADNRLVSELVKKRLSTPA